MKFTHGQPISELLSAYLVEFTDKNDAADVSVKTGVSLSTVLYLKRRVGTVTLNNETAIVELMRKAIKNAETRITVARKCKKDVQRILDLV